MKALSDTIKMSVCVMTGITRSWDEMFGFSRLAAKKQMDYACTDSAFSEIKQSGSDGLCNIKIAKV